MGKPPLRPGDQVGDWKIERTLGEGGMGAVFRAQHAMIPDLYAALKVMKPGQIDDAAERFLREVKAVLRLNHPNIVRVSGFGRDERRGLLWMAMDLVEGGDLEAQLARGAMDLQTVLAMFSGLANALAHAHEHGVFHRDLKPSNVLLDGQGRARLVDFGIAVQQHDSRLTSTGTVIGTPAYLPPELFGGENSDPALGDLYAFGQMMFEAATGTPAFPDDPDLADSQRLVRLMGQKVRSHALDPGEGFPDGLRALVRDLTEPEPTDRLGSAAELASRLAALVQTGGHAVRPVAPARKPQKRSLLAWVAAGGAMVVVLVGGGAAVAAAAGLLIWMSLAQAPGATVPPEPAAEPAVVPDLAGDAAFAAAGAAIPTAPCAGEAGGGDHRAKVTVRIEAGRVAQADPIDGFGTLGFARCLASQVHRTTVDVGDGQGIWTFDHVQDPDPAPATSRATQPEARPAASSAPAPDRATPSRPAPRPDPATHSSSELRTPTTKPAPPKDPDPAPATAQRSPEEIAAEFHRAMAKAQVPVQQCYYRAQAAQPGLEGTIFLAFDLMPDGSTQNVTVVRSELDHAEVERCAVDAFSAIRLSPRPGGQIMRQPSFALKLGTL